MAESGGQPNNQNASKGKMVRSVIKQRLAEKAALTVMVDALIEQAMDGDKIAMNMIFDRCDGKPAQAIVGDRDEDPIDLDIKHTVEFIMPDGTPKG